MLTDQPGKPAQINQKVNMGRSPFVRHRKVCFQAVSTLAVRNDCGTVRVVVDSRRTCLPEFDAGAGQRPAVN